MFKLAVRFVLIFTMFGAGGCWVFERATDPEYEAVVSIPYEEVDDLVSALRNSDYIQKVHVVDEVFDATIDKEKGRSIALTLVFDDNVVIILNKPPLFYFDSFRLRSRYNSLVSAPENAEILSYINHIETIVESLGGQLHLVEGETRIRDE